MEMVMKPVNEQEVQAQIMANQMRREPRQFMIKELGKEKIFKLSTTEAVVEGVVEVVVVDFHVMKLIVKGDHEYRSTRGRQRRETQDTMKLQ
jgi:hypothetical protein